MSQCPSQRSPVAVPLRVMVKLTTRVLRRWCHCSKKGFLFPGVAPASGGCRVPVNPSTGLSAPQNCCCSQLRPTSEGGLRTHPRVLTGPLVNFIFFKTKKTLCSHCESAVSAFPHKTCEVLNSPEEFRNLCTIVKRVLSKPASSSSTIMHTVVVVEKVSKGSILSPLPWAVGAYHPPSCRRTSHKLHATHAVSHHPCYGTTGPLEPRNGDTSKR